MADQAWWWRTHAAAGGDWPNEWTGPPLQISTLTDPTGHVQHGAPTWGSHGSRGLLVTE